MKWRRLTINSRLSCAGKHHSFSHTSLIMISIVFIVLLSLVSMKFLCLCSSSLHTELYSQRTQYSQKAQECQSLKADLTRVKSSLSPAFTSASSVASSPLRPRSAMSVASPTTSPTHSSPSSPTYAPTHQSPLSRSAASSRSSSVTRSTTPSPPSTRPNSPPAVSGRCPPPKMLRSQSADEKEERVHQHQRWIPTVATPDLMAKTRSSSLASSIKRPATAQSSIPPHRYGTPVSR